MVTSLGLLKSKKTQIFNQINLLLRIFINLVKFLFLVIFILVIKSGEQIRKASLKIEG